MGIENSPLRDTMVFLVGARRSGTNWLQRVLATHPEIFAIPTETYLFSSGMRPLSERVHHGPVGARGVGAVFMERKEFLDASRDFCDRLFGGLRERSDPSARLILERTPWHTYHVELIADVYPDASVLHIIRDGRDVARSLLAQSWGPKTMREAAAEWRASVEAARGARKPARYREVRYEQLLADPTATLDGLLRWLGLDARPQTAEQMLAEARVEFNVDPSAPGARAGKWRSLSPDHLADFDRVAGALNAALGYGDEDGPARAGAATDDRHRDRAIARALRSLRGARRRISGRGASRGFEREALNRVRHAQAVFGALLEAMQVEPERIKGLLDEGAAVRMVDRDSEWSGRGPGAVERLITSLSEDPARSGRQVRGDVVPGIPSSTALLAYELPNGSRLERVVSMRIGEGEIREVSIYSIPTG